MPARTPPTSLSRSQGRAARSSVASCRPLSFRTWKNSRRRHRNSRCPVPSVPEAVRQLPKSLQQASLKLRQPRADRPLRLPRHRQLLPPPRQASLQSAQRLPRCLAAGPRPSDPGTSKKLRNRLRLCLVADPVPSAPERRHRQRLLSRQPPRLLQPPQPKQQSPQPLPSLQRSQPSPQLLQRLPTRNPNSLPRCPVAGPVPSDRQQGKRTHKSALPARIRQGGLPPLSEEYPLCAPERGWRASQGRCLWLT